MYCKNCGKEIDEKAVICPHCGVEVKALTVVPAAIEETSTSYLWGILGCCIPIVGLILFIVWKDTKPKSAKAAGIGAIVCVAGIILLYAFVFFMAFISTIRMSPYYY